MTIRFVVFISFLFTAIIMGLLPACKVKKKGEVKFIPLARQLDDLISDVPSYYKEIIIIGRVHQKELHINYEGMRDDSEFTRLSRLVEDALRLWLSALSAEKNIVDTFKHTNNKEDVNNLDYDLTISMDCPPKRGTSAHYTLGDREICMANSNKMLEFRYLAHEIGHAFGLGDTYYYKIKPQSIMCCAVSVLGGYEASDGNFPLPLDDADGIRYIYSKVFKEKTDLCPDYYTYEESNMSCLPTITALVRSGVFHKVIRGSFARNFEEVDEDGNTPLHHAAMLIQAHGDFTYRYLLNFIKRRRYRMQINKNYKEYLKAINKNGKTPLDIYQRLKADVNRDGEINILDLVMVSQQVGKSFIFDVSCYDNKDCLAIINAEISGDTIVDKKDLAIVSKFINRQ